MKIFIAITSLALLAACASGEADETIMQNEEKAKELELKEKELDQKEKELDLKAEESEKLDNSTSEPVRDQTNPKWVVEQVFLAAKTEDYSKLQNFCDPEGEGDGDTRDICAVSTADAEMQAGFRDYFKSGLAGETKVDGDKAMVDILFGPD